ncbi:MAG: phage terminase large subunit [Alphaproteobacteria bacterium]|nr:phage terminase large subunit [Alphaproteobacteria bacterium]
MWNQTQGQETPSLHLDMARWLGAQRDALGEKILSMAFRAAGKSTVLGLFCAWMLARNPDLRILVLAAEFELACKMVRNVKRIIERHPLTGDMKPARLDQWASDQFTVNRPSVLRDPSVLARGVSGNITGSRADMVICDDVEVPNTCDTPPKRAALRARLSEIDYVLAPGGMQVFAGTPHSYYTIYAKAVRPESGEDTPFLDGFQRLELPILKADGHSRWPERYTDKDIAALKRRHGPNKFSGQMMLQPVNLSEGRLDPDRMRPYDEALDYAERNRTAVLSLGGIELASASCWWDPSYGASTRGDGSVIAIVFTDRKGGYWLHDIRYLQVDPDSSVDEATQQCRQVAAFLRENFAPSVSIEVNGLGRFLPGLLRRELGLTGVGCAVVEVSSRQPKAARIMDGFDAVLAAGALHTRKTIWQTPFVQEMREWRPGGGYSGPDDGLDAVSGCLLSEPVRLPRVVRANSRAWGAGGGSFNAETAFDI